MSFIKYPLPESVLQATEQRIQWVMDNFFAHLCLFFRGKDSTVMLHLTAQAARLQGKKICVLFIDWEAQFSCTIAHCEKNCVRCMRMSSETFTGSPCRSPPKMP